MQHSHTLCALAFNTDSHKDVESPGAREKEKYAGQKENLSNALVEECPLDRGKADTI